MQDSSNLITTPPVVVSSDSPEGYTSVAMLVEAGLVDVDQSQTPETPSEE